VHRLPGGEWSDADTSSRPRPARASPDTAITITGNLVDMPELRYTPAGQPVTKFRIASRPRYKDNATGEWKDGDTLFLTCQAWRQLAEHIARGRLRRVRAIVRESALIGRGHAQQRPTGGRGLAEHETHFDLPGCQLVRASWEGGGGGSPGVGLDEPAGDRRGQQGVSAAATSWSSGMSFDQESARAGDKRPVDVFAEIEGGEDDDLGAGAWRAGRWRRCRRRRACGCP
jgi:single-strand DNA-binding protein